MDNRIAELTKTIYEEGIEKAKAESNRILQEAEKKAAEIIAHAEEKRDAIIKEATLKAQELKKNTEAEIKLSCNQAIAGLKQTIVDIFINKMLDKPVKTVLSDPSVLKEIIIQIVKNWKGSEDLEVLLPDSFKKDIEQSFIASVKDVVGKGLEIKFSDSIQAGFQILPSGSSFKINMTDEDFNEFFKSYLRPKLRDFLFGNK